MSEPLNFNLASQFTGSLSVIFYFALVLFPYYSSFKKGKIDNQDFTLSKAMEYANQNMQVFLVFNFTFFSMCLFTYRGVMFGRDQRIAFPILMWAFTMSIVSLLWITAEYKIDHSLLALVVILSGQIFGLLVWGTYRDYYPEEENFKALESLTWIAFIVVLCIAPVYFYKNTKILGILEILHALLNGCVLIAYVTLPPLPVNNINQEIPKNENEAKKIIKE